MLGEHAVVYGRPAIALPIPLAVEASVRKESSQSDRGIYVVIPRWGLEQRVNQQTQGFSGIMAQLVQKMGLAGEHMTIEVFPHVPRAMGLGGSSALAVAIIRALNETYQLRLSLGQINDLAFDCEKAAHGTPSGVDNTVATYGTSLFYQRENETARFADIKLAQPLDLVIGMTGKESLTADTVARVRRSWEHYPARYEAIFTQIGLLTESAKEAVQGGQLNELGELMNLCHGYLNALQLATPELEELIHIEGHSSPSLKDEG